MARIRHIAIGTRDPEATARFYIEVKFSGPDGVTIDLSEHGWSGTK